MWCCVVWFGGVGGVDGCGMVWTSMVCLLEEGKWNEWKNKRRTK